MRNIYQLIKLCRKQTENEEYSSVQGISDEEFIEYLNDAQSNLQANIVNQHPKVFTDEAIINVVPGTESYKIPSDCFLGNKIFNVEYSPTGHIDDYYVISENIMKYRSSGVDGSPTRYIRLSGKLLLSPVPSTTGTLRINYVKALPELRLPLGVISSIESVQSPSVHIINFSTANIPNSISIKDVSYYNKYSICTDEGEMLEKDLKHSYNGIRTVGTLSVNPTVSSANLKEFNSTAYLMPGGNSTFIPNLDSSIIRYLVAYCNWKILKRDSSVDSQEAMEELRLMAQNIVSSYANISDDIQLIPQLNNWDDWSV